MAGSMCPECHTDDDVDYPPRRLPGGVVQYTCRAGHDHTGPLVFTSEPISPPRTTPSSDTSSKSEARITEELLQPLRACVYPDEPFVEYGIVEHRFRLANPELFTKHVEQSGHVMLGRRHNLGSASRDRFAKALHRLADKGELVKKMGRGTGAWEHNLYDTYYWALPPAPPGPLLTWVEYCTDIGRSPEWTDEDRAPFPPQATPDS